jgi:hypothetical protein
VKNKISLIFFALFAFINTGLFTQITYSKFEGVRQKMAPSENFPENRALAVPLPGIPLKDREIMILSLKVENEGGLPKRIEVFFNSSKLGVLFLKAREVKEFHSDLRNDTPGLTDNTVSLRGPDDGWRLLNYRISNMYGFSHGPMEYILIPKATRTYQRHGAFIWLLVFLAIFLLGAVSPLKTSHLERLISRLARFLALFIIISAVLLPIVSKYRILISFHSLWIFVLFLYLSSTLRILRTFHQKGLATIRLSRPFRGLTEIVSPRENVVIAFFFSVLVFFFYFHIMLDHLKVYKGNFSGFVSLREDLVTGINPIFWNASAEQLFENSDFEKGTLENWTAQGNAFRFQPTKGANIRSRRSSMPFNYQGEYWVGTSQKYQGRPGEVRGTKKGDRPNGTLTSLPFVIKKDRIGFLIGGGRSRVDKKPVRESVALEVNGEIVKETSGKNRETMELQVWEVARWKGQLARIIITDSAVRGSGWGHINADWFHYYQEDRMSQIQKNLLVSPSGYDAQFFYFMAYDPFLLRFKDEPRKYRVLTDEPRYRYERIAFPLLIKAVSLDRPEFYPQAMMALILLSHLLAAFFLVRIVQFFGQSPFWALFYILVPGYQVSLARALPESLVMAFILAGWYFYLKGKILTPSILFSISLLTRETAALAVIPLILWEFFKEKNPRKALILSMSFLPLIGWKFYLTIRLFDIYGWTTLFVGFDNLGFPFSGIIGLYRRALARSITPELLPASIIYPLLLFFLFMFSLYLLWKRRDFLSLGLCLFSLISVSLNYPKVWVHIDNAVRTTTEPFLFLVIVFASQRASLRKPFVWLVLCFFILVFMYDFCLLTFHDFFRAGFFLK